MTEAWKVGPPTLTGSYWIIHDGYKVLGYYHLEEFRVIGAKSWTWIKNMKINYHREVDVPDWPTAEEDQ